MSCALALLFGMNLMAWITPLCPWIHVIILVRISLTTLTKTLPKMKESRIPEKCLMSSICHYCFDNNCFKITFQIFDNADIRYILTELCSFLWNLRIYHSFLLSHSCHFILFNHESLSFNMINKAIPKQLQAKANKMSLER